MDELISVKEVAKRLAVSERTVSRWIADGRIKAYRTGPRLIRVDVHSLDFLYEEVHYAKRHSGYSRQ